MVIDQAVVDSEEDDVMEMDADVIAPRSHLTLPQKMRLMILL